MSQVAQQGVKHAAEVNKPRGHKRPVTLCFMSRLEDSILGYVGHMVTLVTVKLLPCESGRLEVVRRCTEGDGQTDQLT